MASEHAEHEARTGLGDGGDGGGAAEGINVVVAIDLLAAAAECDDGVFENAGRVAEGFTEGAEEDGLG